jgi:hypothetical protein
LIPFCCKIFSTLSRAARICPFINLQIFKRMDSKHKLKLTINGCFSEKNLSVRVKNQEVRNYRKTEKT